MARALSSLSPSVGERDPWLGRPCSRVEGAALARSLARPPCRRVPPLAAAAPALAPYLELRHPDVGGARPAAPPRLAPARGRRRPAAQPSRASRGRPSPKTPGLRPRRLAPHFLGPPGGRAALPAAAARGKSRPGPHAGAGQPESLCSGDPQCPPSPAVPLRSPPARDPPVAQPAASPASPIARAGDVGAAPRWPGGTGGVRSRSPAAPRGSVSCRSFTARTESRRESVARQAPGSAGTLDSRVLWFYPSPFLAAAHLVPVSHPQVSGSPSLHFLPCALLVLSLSPRFSLSLGLCLCFRVVSLVFSRSRRASRPPLSKSKHPARASEARSPSWARGECLWHYKRPQILLFPARKSGRCHPPPLAGAERGREQAWSARLPELAGVSSGESLVSIPPQ